MTSLLPTPPLPLPPSLPAPSPAGGGSSDWLIWGPILPKYKPHTETGCDCADQGEETALLCLLTSDTSGGDNCHQNNFPAFSLCQWGNLLLTDNFQRNHKLYKSPISQGLMAIVRNTLGAGIFIISQCFLQHCQNISNSSQPNDFSPTYNNLYFLKFFIFGLSTVS